MMDSKRSRVSMEGLSTEQPRPPYLTAVGHARANAKLHEQKPTAQQGWLHRADSSSPLPIKHPRINEQRSLVSPKRTIGHEGFERTQSMTGPTQGRHKKDQDLEEMCSILGIEAAFSQMTLERGSAPEGKPLSTRQLPELDKLSLGTPSGAPHPVAPSSREGNMISVAQATNKRTLTDRSNTTDHQRSTTRPPKRRRLKVAYRDGEIVGEMAPQIGADNRGRVMLEKMGWTAGTALGLSGGSLEPITHVVKTSRAGLGGSRSGGVPQKEENRAQKVESKDAKPLVTDKKTSEVLDWRALKLLTRQESRASVEGQERRRRRLINRSMKKHGGVLLPREMARIDELIRKEVVKAPIDVVRDKVGASDKPSPSRVMTRSMYKAAGLAVPELEPMHPSSVPYTTQQGRPASQTRAMHDSYRPSGYSDNWLPEPPDQPCRDPVRQNNMHLNHQTLVQHDEPYRMAVLERMRAVGWQQKNEYNMILHVGERNDRNLDVEDRERLGTKEDHSVTFIGQTESVTVPDAGVSPTNRCPSSIASIEQRATKITGDGAPRSFQNIDNLGIGSHLYRKR